MLETALFIRNYVFQTLQALVTLGFGTDQNGRIHRIREVVIALSCISCAVWIIAVAIHVVEFVIARRFGDHKVTVISGAILTHMVRLPVMYQLGVVNTLIKMAISSLPLTLLNQLGMIAMDDVVAVRTVSALCNLLMTFILATTPWWLDPVTFFIGVFVTEVTEACKSLVQWRMNNPLPLVPMAVLQGNEEEEKYDNEGGGPSEDSGQCRQYQQHGVCSYGERCKFHHGDPEKPAERRRMEQVKQALSQKQLSDVDRLKSKSKQSAKKQQRSFVPNASTNAPANKPAVSNVRTEKDPSNHEVAKPLAAPAATVTTTNTSSGSSAPVGKSRQVQAQIVSMDEPGTGAISGHEGRRLRPLPHRWKVYRVAKASRHFVTPSLLGSDWSRTNIKSHQMEVKLVSNVVDELAKWWTQHSEDGWNRETFARSKVKCEALLIELDLTSEELALHMAWAPVVAAAQAKGLQEDIEVNLTEQWWVYIAYAIAAIVLIVTVTCLCVNTWPDDGKYWQLTRKYDTDFRDSVLTGTWKRTYNYVISLTQRELTVVSYAECQKVLSEQMSWPWHGTIIETTVLYTREMLYTPSLIQAYYCEPFGYKEIVDYITSTAVLLWYMSVSLLSFARISAAGVAWLVPLLLILRYRGIRSKVAVGEEVTKRIFIAFFSLVLPMWQAVVSVAIINAIADLLADKHYLRPTWFKSDRVKVLVLAGRSAAHALFTLLPLPVAVFLHSVNNYYADQGRVPHLESDVAVSKRRLLMAKAVGGRRFIVRRYENVPEDGRDVEVPRELKVGAKIREPKRDPPRARMQRDRRLFAQILYGLGIEGYEPVAYAPNYVNEKAALYARVMKATPRPNPATMADFRRFVRANMRELFGRRIRVKPMDYDEWLKACGSSPQVKEQLRTAWKQMVDEGFSYDMKLTPRQLYEWTRRESFVKVENNNYRTPLGRNYKASRLIQGGKKEFVNATGPFFAALQGVIKKRWGTKNFVCFTSGVHIDDAAEYISSPPDFSIVEDDVGAFDASISEDLCELEIEIAEWFGAPRVVLDLMRENMKTHGVTGSGLRYRVKGTRKSGDPWTSLMNSIINALMHIYIFCKETGMSVSEAKKCIKMLVQGDDNLMRHIPGVVIDWKARMLELGFKAEGLYRSTLAEAEFCSLRMLPVRGTWRFVAKAGRQMAKLGWFINPPSYATPESLMRGVALSSWGQFRYSPPLRAWVEHVLELTKGVEALAPRSEEHKMLSSARDDHGIDAATFETFSQQYLWTRYHQTQFEKELKGMKLGDLTKHWTFVQLIERDTNGPQQLFRPCLTARDRAFGVWRPYQPFNTMRRVLFVVATLVALLCGGTARVESDSVTTVSVQNSGSVDGLVCPSHGVEGQSACESRSEILVCSPSYACRNHKAGANLPVDPRLNLHLLRTRVVGESDCSTEANSVLPLSSQDTDLEMALNPLTILDGLTNSVTKGLSAGRLARPGAAARAAAEASRASKEAKKAGKEARRAFSTKDGSSNNPERKRSTDNSAKPKSANKESKAVKKEVAKSQQLAAAAATRMMPYTGGTFAPSQRVGHPVARANSPYDKMVSVVWNPFTSVDIPRMGSGDIPTQIFHLSTMVIANPGTVTSGGTYLATHMWPGLYQTGGGFNYAKLTNATVADLTVQVGTGTAIGANNADVPLSNFCGSGGYVRLLGMGMQYSVMQSASVAMPVVSLTDQPAGAAITDSCMSLLQAMTNSKMVMNACPQGLSGYVCSLPARPLDAYVMSTFFNPTANVSYTSSWTVPSLYMYWPQGGTTTISVMVKYHWIVEAAIGIDKIKAGTATYSTVAQTADESKVGAYVINKVEKSLKHIGCGGTSMAYTPQQSMAGSTERTVPVPTDPPSDMSGEAVAKQCQEEAQENAKWIEQALPVLQKLFPDLPPYPGKMRGGMPSGYTQTTTAHSVYACQEEDAQRERANSLEENDNEIKSALQQYLVQEQFKKLGSCIMINPPTGSSSTPASASAAKARS